jgi:hypothetical protein
MSSFVLFAQILDSLATNVNGLIQYPEPIEVIRNILTFCYRFFNLNFFTIEQLSFCLWKGATVLDVLLTKYATVGFALLLVLVTIFIVRCRYVRFRIFHTPNSVLIHGLSTFFILSYSQSARTTFHILNYFCLYSKGFHCKETFVYRVGYMTYFGTEHVKYAVVAMIVLIFMVIIPPLLLMIYPLSFKLLGRCKLSESKLTKFLWRAMPIQLLDAFQSSFKDEFRFFAGMYFLYRAIILGAFAYAQTLNVFYITVQVQLTVVLALHAMFQPYKSRRHNIIDALLFANLAIVNGITLYNYTVKTGDGLNVSQHRVSLLAALQIVFIALPLLIVVIVCVEKIAAAHKRKRLRTLDSDSLPSLREDEIPDLSYRKLP